MPDEYSRHRPEPRTRRNLVHAFGFSAHGFELGPIGGQIVAELVTRRPQHPADRRLLRWTASRRRHALNAPTFFPSQPLQKGQFIMSDIQRYDSNARLSRIVVHNSVVYLAGVTAARRASGDVKAQAAERARHHRRATWPASAARTSPERLLSVQIWLQGHRPRFRRPERRLGRVGSRRRHAHTGHLRGQAGSARPAAWKSSSTAAL